MFFQKNVFLMEIATAKAEATTRTGLPHKHTPLNSTLNLAISHYADGSTASNKLLLPKMCIAHRFLCKHCLGNIKSTF